MTKKFHLAHIFRTQSMLTNFEHYLEILNLLYLEQEPVDFDKFFRSECKIQKENYFADEIFSI